MGGRRGTGRDAQLTGVNVHLQQRAAHCVDIKYHLHNTSDMRVKLAAAAACQCGIEHVKTVATTASTRTYINRVEFSRLLLS